MVFVGWICAMGKKGKSLIAHLRFVLKFGPQHASPNSGGPEAALASLLDCRFGGPHNYFGEYFYKPYIGDNPRELNTSDMRFSIKVCLLSECLVVVIIASVLLFV